MSDRKNPVKYFLEQSWLLLVSAFLFGLMLAMADSAWSDRIKQNNEEKINSLRQKLIADAVKYEPAVEKADIGIIQGRQVTVNIYRALDSAGRCAGYTFQITGQGFAGKIELVVAVDPRCEKILGYEVLSASETPGFGDKIFGDYFRNQFAGAPVGKLTLIKAGDDKKIDDDIVAISGATVSSTAVVNAFNTYIEKIKESLQQKGLLQDVQ